MTTRNTTSPINTDSPLAAARKRLQSLRDGNAYYEGDDPEGFGYVDGYLAACSDFEDILNDVFPAEETVAVTLPYEVATEWDAHSERDPYPTLEIAYSTAHALIRHMNKVSVWHGKTLHCAYDKADGEWKTLTPEATALATEWDERVAEAQANPDRQELPLWFLHR